MKQRQSPEWESLEKVVILIGWLFHIMIKTLEMLRSLSLSPKTWAQMAGSRQFTTMILVETV